MAKEEILIDLKIGIHGRPAALLVQKINSYPQNIVTISKNGKSTNGKSLMGLLSLSISQGNTITIEVTGENDTVVLRDIINLIKETLPKQ